MLEVTKPAVDQIAEYFKGKNVKPIRIFLNEGGWGGPGLAMALDEPIDTDTTFDIDGFQFIVNTEFLEKAQPIKVDFHMYGFKLDCGIDFGAGCGSCGTKGSCCA